MNTYNINFEYNIPQFTEITLDAQTSADAEQKAMLEFEAAYPEALDVEVVKVSLV